MSQMPRQAALPTCPSCAEPLDAGDRFCGACGYDLSAVPRRPDDHPTLTMNGSAQPAPAEATAGPMPSGTAVPVAGASGAPMPVAGASGAGAGGVAPGALPPDGVPTAQSGPGVPVPPVPGSPLPPPPAASPVTGAAGVPGASGASGASGVSGVRFDRPSEPDEYALQAPDPRVAAEAAAVAETAQVCVACRAGRVDDDGYCENCGHAQPRERDHMELESGPLAAVSDRGLRHHRNEDAFGLACAALPDGSPALVAIVCDGVSSATRPDDASLAASRAAKESLLTALPQGTHPQQAMHEAIIAASYAVNALADEPATAREQAPHQNAPACTLVGSIVTPGLLVVGWVGDSRAYWVPADRTSPRPGSPRTTRGPRRWSPRA